MTVLSFADTRFPIERANGMQTMATCHALAARGHDVTLVVRPDTAKRPRDPFAFYGFEPNVRLRVVTVPAQGGPRRRRVRFLLAAVARVRATPGAVIYTRDLGLAAFLLQLPAGRRPRVVYESHGISSIVAAEMPRLLGKPELVPSDRKIARLDRRERRVWSRAHAYVTITRALADDLASRYGPRRLTFIVPDGARPPANHNRVETAAANTPPFVAYAGHLYPWKGVDVLLAALAKIPDARGLVIGGHPGEADLARIRALADDLGVGARVEITGLIAPGAVAAELGRASILVLPNTATAISDRYTSPLKLFEYLSAGRPIIASDLAAVREVLTDGTTALLVPPGDASALASAIRRILSDRTLAESLAHAARQLATEYTWEQRARRLEPALEAARS